MKKITKALITAGGRGTRLRPITHTLNKHLIPIANKPMIVHALEKVCEAGIREVGINVNVGEQELQKVLGDGSNWGVHITYIEQVGGALGLAHIIKNAESFLQGDNFLFYLGDNIIRGSISPFVQAFATSDVNCYLALSQVPDPERFGVPELRDGKIVSVEEKPKKPKSNFAVTGIYLYDKSIYEAVNAIKPSARGELEISDAHQYLLDHGKSIGYQEITGWWKDTGKPLDLLEGNQLLLRDIKQEILATTIDPDSKIEGLVSIGKNVTIKEDVTIRGPVVIGDNSTLVSSYIGPYTSIGHDVTIEHTELEHSIVMNHAHLKAHARIIDSIIGCYVEITSTKENMPQGHKMIVGDNAVVTL